MMSHDVNPGEAIFNDNSQNAYERMHDARLDRDMQKDLHDAIDLSFGFIKKLKELHPVAYGQIKAMLLTGKLI